MLDELARLESAHFANEAAYIGMIVNRLKIILTSTVLGILAGAVPIALMVWLSWNSAVEAEQQRLQSFATRVLDRSAVSLGQAFGALSQLNADKPTVCSPEHIAKMRMQTVNTRSVEQIGYFQKGLLKCTSWGIVDKTIAQSPIDFTTSSGMAVTLEGRPGVTGGGRMVSVHMGHYNALISADRFADVIADARTVLALARGTDVVAVSDAESSHAIFLQRVLRGDINGKDAEFLYAVAEREGWTAVAFSGRDDVVPGFNKQLKWMIPIGIFISLVIVFLAIKVTQRRLSPRAELELGVKNREFVVHYQPIMDLRTGRCVGAEALVRWNKSDGTMVRPDLFIPLAEETGLIMDITDQVIEKIVSELSSMLILDRSLHIALNLCAEDIRTGRVLPVIDAALEASGISHEQIWIEATERGFMDIESSKETLNKARQSGHSAAIDDFGTGYSSLQHLQGLPLDALKIDKAFVSTIGADTVSSAVIGHIIEMAKSLKLFIVAEGVESQKQADYLAARGVDFVQGWFYSKALPAKEFLAFYEATVESLGAGPVVIRKH
ncbi:EAL domain-containing protein [Herbaspirillum chlorophenolicum]|uniref:cyclic-guanylate-specific phosphodiesterase n=1 Tax=Herbaspirillum chlorophenolicum TaxID=211589 RepID=A0ABW8ETK0_9BURK